MKLKLMLLFIVLGVSILLFSCSKEGLAGKAVSGSEQVPAPIHWWKFNEMQGNIVHDSIGSSDGMLYSIDAENKFSEPINGGWVEGDFGKGYDFSLSNSLSDVMKISGEDFKYQQFSVELWFKADSILGNSILITTEPYHDWVLIMGNGQVRSYVKYYTNQQGLGAVSSTKILQEADISKWHQVIMTYGGVNEYGYILMNLYLDGELVGKDDVEGSVIYKGESIYLGSRIVKGLVNGELRYYPDLNFNGVIDELALYDRALTSVEVQTLFAAGSVQDDAVTSDSSSENQEIDTDSDGAINSIDNCPSIANTDQLDSEYNDEGQMTGDGVGDACDNCRLFFNSDQADIDLDGIGDICDNCPNIVNPDQLDTDHNSVGQACEDASRLTIQPDALTLFWQKFNSAIGQGNIVVVVEQELINLLNEYRK